MIYSIIRMMIAYWRDIPTWYSWQKYGQIFLSYLIWWSYMFYQKYYLLWQSWDLQFGSQFVAKKCSQQRHFQESNSEAIMLLIQSKSGENKRDGFERQQRRLKGMRSKYTPQGSLLPQPNLGVRWGTRPRFFGYRCIYRWQCHVTFHLGVVHILRNHG